jgi:replicative DNA helicase
MLPVADWVHISDVYKESLAYIMGRRDGHIKSLLTPWPTLNNLGIDGVEWNTINVLGARPGTGKTLFVNQFTRSAFALNPGQDFAVLDCQWEMIYRTMGLRDISAGIGKSIQELASAKGVRLDDVDLKAAEHYMINRSYEHIYVAQDPKTVANFEKMVDDFFKAYNKPMIVTIDHALLFLKNGTDTDNMLILHKLGEALTRMKRRYPVIFFVLSQLNRNSESSDRLKNASAGNYLLDSDLYGSDALLMHTDMLLMLNRPGKHSIKEYGPHKYPVTNNTIAVHVNKMRNGAIDMFFLDAHFHNMRMVEYDPLDDPKYLAAQIAQNQKNASNLHNQAFSANMPLGNFKPLSMSQILNQP